MKFLKLSIFSLILILVVNYTALIFISNRNYSHNKNLDYSVILDNQGYIREQAITNEIKYGVRYSDFNGCGWIALHNVLNYYDESVEIYEIIQYLDRYGLNIYGLLGTDPLAIIMYLRKFDLNARISFSSEDFEELSSQSDAIIMGYISKSMNEAHYQAGIKSNNDEFQFYVPYRKKSMESYLEKYYNYFNFLIYID